MVQVFQMICILVSVMAVASCPHLQAKVKNETVTRCGQDFVSHWCYVISQAAREEFPEHAVPHWELE